VDRYPPTTDQNHPPRPCRPHPRRIGIGQKGPTG
jgi:hypothetical protein